MTRALIVGFEVPIFDSASAPTALNHRTWQLTEALLNSNHQVYLCARTQSRGATRTNHPQSPIGNLTYDHVNFGRPGWVKHIYERTREFEAQCIISVGFLSSLCVTKLRTDLPIWMDVYGDNLFENQLSMAAQGSDRGLLTGRWFDKQVLMRGDVFSVCSTPQKYALLGRLAAFGRVNRHTLGYEFVHVGLPGSLFSAENHRGGGDAALDIGTVTQERIKFGDFVVLWCGTYNTWVDLDLLFEGISLTMEQSPRIVYLSVGGPTVDSAGYNRLLERINNSPFKSRFIMLGRRPFSETRLYYAASHCGISVDRNVYESQIGTRTRLVDMAAAGLPVVTTDTCELARIMAQAKAAVTFPTGDPRGLVSGLLSLSNDENLRREMAQNGKSFVDRCLSPNVVLQPLLDWAVRPWKAPDHRCNVKTTIKDKAGFLARVALWKIGGQAVRQ